MYVGNTPPSVTLQRSNNEGLRWVTGDFIGFTKNFVCCCLLLPNGRLKKGRGSVIENGHERMCNNVISYSNLLKKRICNYRAKARRD